MVKTCGDYEIAKKVWFVVPPVSSLAILPPALLNDVAISRPGYVYVPSRSRFFDVFLSFQARILVRLSLTHDERC